MDKLKECPFCGGKNIKIGSRTCSIGEDIYIKCSCGAKIQIRDDFGLSELINRWNKRA